MKEKHLLVSHNVLLTNVQTFTQQGENWHHHFLTPDCALGGNGKYQIVLENDDTKESFVCEFDEKPMKELKEIEELFFQSK